MARYSTFKYGSGKKYGLSTNNTVGWAIQVDWNDSGDFSSNDSAYTTDLVIQRGRDFYIRLASGDAEGFEYVRPGRAYVTLDNSTGRYNPFNTSSPLYPNILPGKYIKIRSRYGATTYDVFSGIVTDIQPVSGGMEQVRLECIDGMQYLNDQGVDVNIQTSIGVDDAANLILDAANWPALWGRDIQATTAALPYWWTRGKRALSELNDLADSVAGVFYCKANGAARFMTSAYSGAAAAVITQSEVLRQIVLPQPWEVIRNYIRIGVNPRSTQAAAVLWELNEVPSIQNDETLERWATYSYNNQEVPASVIIEPVATTDYTANSAADGSGTNYTANIVITRTSVNGTTSKIQIYNSGPAAYITFLQLRGTAVYINNSFEIISQDAVSQAQYGRRNLRINSDWIQSTFDAQMLANWLIGYLPNSLYFPIVTIENRPDIQFSADLFDTVQFSSTTLGIPPTYYRCGYIEHRWAVENGNSTITTWKLEGVPVVVGDYWTFPTQIGVTSIFGL